MQQDELKCIACGYDLRGQSSGSVCPECGEAVLYAIIGARDPALFKRESGMLRKQDVYRRNRNASIFLAVAGVLSLLLFLTVLPYLGERVRLSTVWESSSHLAMPPSGPLWPMRSMRG